jgi:hypothetical protein
MNVSKIIFSKNDFHLFLFLENKMNLKVLSTLFFLVNNNGYPLFYRKYNGFGLDINGKDGVSRKEIENNFPYVTFYGVDDNKKNILKLQKENPSLNFLYMDIENDNISNLYKKFQVVHISNYNNLENMLEKTKKLLEDKSNSVCILRYKEKDILKIKQLVLSNKYKPKQYYLGLGYSTMHHIPENRTLLWFT